MKETKKEGQFHIAKLEQWLMLGTCILMMMAVAINRDGKLFGHRIGQQQNVAAAVPVEISGDIRMSGDTIVVNTTYLGKDIQGYNGPIPLEVYIYNDKVVYVKALDNIETPHFFARAFEGLKDKWTGMSVSKASELEVDGVSGATFSSNAIIKNVQLALNHMQASTVSKTGSELSTHIKPKFIIGLIVVLMAAILPLFIKNKWYVIIQMLLNIGVLGIWCGTFVSYTSMVTFLSGGFHWAYMILIIMIIVAFIYPLFGKKQYYCTNICPFGSLQQLMGYCSKKKIKMNVKLIKGLEWFRQILWAVLMLCLWLGVFFEWMDYELFTAFLFQTASPVIIACAIVIALLSIFISRPYCRFICPTGTLIKTSELSK